jgi:hypothetical protein
MCYNILERVSYAVIFNVKIYWGKPVIDLHIYAHLFQLSELYEVKYACGPFNCWNTLHFPKKCIQLTVTRYSSWPYLLENDSNNKIMTVWCTSVYLIDSQLNFLHRSLCFKWPIFNVWQRASNFVAASSEYSCQVKYHEKAFKYSLFLPLINQKIVLINYLLKRGCIYCKITKHIVQTGSGVHPTSYKMGTEGFFPKVKRQGREADHSPPTSAEVKKMWIYTSTPLYVFMA